jgi:hypothetical protein
MHYTAVLAAYRAQDWDTAEHAFRECLSIDANDRPAQLFLERIAAFRLHPPGPTGIRPGSSAKSEAVLILRTGVEASDGDCGCQDVPRH